MADPHSGANVIGVNLVEATIFEHAKFKPGTKVIGNDGHDWFFVENVSGAAIPAGFVQFAEPDFQVTAGGTDFQSAFEIPDGKYAFVQRVAL